MSSLSRLRLVYNRGYHGHYRISYINIAVRYRSKSGGGGLVHNDSSTSRWVGTYRRLPPNDNIILAFVSYFMSRLIGLDHT